jgi:hypothetical protein
MLIFVSSRVATSMPFSVSVAILTAAIIIYTAIFAEKAAVFAAACTV